MSAAEKANLAATYDERRLECRNLQMQETFASELAPIALPSGQRARAQVAS